MLKIQVKTSHQEDGGFEFSTCSSHYVRGKHVHTSYKDDGIDYFCTYYNEVVYLIPVGDCGKDSKKLRLEPTKSGQVKGIAFAKNYIAKEVLEK